MPYSSVIDAEVSPEFCEGPDELKAQLRLESEASYTGLRNEILNLKTTVNSQNLIISRLVDRVIVLEQKVGVMK